MTDPNSKLLINESPLQVLPSLAIRIGLEEAIVLQQIHYWLHIHSKAGNNRNYKSGRFWGYNTCKQWQQQFRWWSLPTIKRILTGLEQMHLITSQKFHEKERDQTKWYTINYKALSLIEQMPDSLWKLRRDERIKLIRAKCEEVNLISSEDIESIHTSKSNKITPPSSPLNQEVNKSKKVEMESDNQSLVSSPYHLVLAGKSDKPKLLIPLLSETSFSSKLGNLSIDLYGGFLSRSSKSSNSFGLGPFKAARKVKPLHCIGNSQGLVTLYILNQERNIYEYIRSWR